MKIVASSDTLDSVVALMREISGQSDPQAMLHAYAAHMQGVTSFDRTVSLSRREMKAPGYRITRSDLWEREINPWTEPELLPVMEGGLLGELLYGGKPRIIDVLEVGEDDPAKAYFAGMRSLAAIPHFDDRAAVNMVVHMQREAGAFDAETFPQLVLVSGMFGRAMKGLVLAADLRKAQETLQRQYHAVTELSDTVLEQARALKTHSSKLEQRVRARTAELEASHLDAIYMLAAASEEKDMETAQHLRRMEHLTMGLALALGMAEGEARSLAEAAILHDVGKLHVPDHILKKPGPLTEEERRVMEEHTLASERILPDRAYFAMARRVGRSHHENEDGTGYPDGLKGEKIPFEARVVHLVDVYDALTSVRPYKGAWGVEAARAFLAEQRGRMFAPELVDVFLAMDLNKLTVSEGVRTHGARV